MKYLKKLINQHINIEDNEWKILSLKFRKVSVKKSGIISNAGDIFTDFYFIRSGLARSYFTDLDGKDLTWQVYFRGRSKYGLNHFMDDSVSYYENDVPMLNFAALEDSVFYVVSLKEMDSFLKSEYKKWEDLAKIWIHDIYFTSTYKRVKSYWKRIKSYENNGADGIFVPSIVDVKDIKEVVKAVKLPIKITAMPSLLDFNTLEDICVKRLSPGPFLYKYNEENFENKLLTINKNNSFGSLLQ